MPRIAMTPQALDKTRRRLLEATARIIASEGYAAFSMRRLGLEVGLTAGALYRYFPTRQHVLVAYWTDALDVLARRLAAILAAPQPSLERIRALVLAYADFALEDRDRFRVLFIENDLGAFSDLDDKHDLLSAYRLFLTGMEEAGAAGLFGSMPVATAAHVLWGAVHGVLSLALTVDDVDFGDTRSLAEAAADVALRGLTHTVPETGHHAR